jgi:hypothetical protein
LFEDISGVSKRNIELILNEYGNSYQFAFDSGVIKIMTQLLKNQFANNRELR